ncbi:MAG: hypothetical protein IPK02_20260 [Candidatus Accumulibacter sp.]|uniref:Uncharacterized protein n=1 Tax=Candidatus Accumulibacter affinis TaxID=2954384 RepID=A0A935TCM9_9PROT|nr:hypothetical protein [Candidatus Accumulibacter affinis]
MPIRDLAQDLVTFSPGAWSSFWVVFYGFVTYGNAGLPKNLKVLGALAEILPEMG